MLKYVFLLAAAAAAGASAELNTTRLHISDLAVLKVKDALTVN